VLTTKNSTELKIGTAGWEQKKRKRNFSPTKIYETGHKRLQEVKPKAHILPRQLPLELQRKTAESSKRKTGSPPSSKNSGAKTDNLLQKLRLSLGLLRKKALPETLLLVHSRRLPFPSRCNFSTLLSHSNPAGAAPTKVD
jgi:hypothetical protein